MLGKITAITRQKKEQTRASIYLEGEFALGVNEQTIEEFRLRKGDYIDLELYEKILDFDYWISAKRIALRYLNYRSRSEKEIRDRLDKEDIPPEIIQRVMEFLSGYDLVNDAKWAEAFTNDKLKKKAVSSRQLASELRMKGVDKEIIEQTVSKLDAAEPEANRAFDAAQKRWPRIVRTEPDEKKRKQKLICFLGTRGFSFEIISGVYKKLTQESLEEEE